jgi:hypothetical protein
VRNIILAALAATSVALAGISSAAAATVQAITQPDAAYQAATTRIDLSGALDGSVHSSIGDGALTLSFSTGLAKHHAGVAGTDWPDWGAPPNTESSEADALWAQGATILVMGLSQPAATFGFELRSLSETNATYLVDFRSGGATLGTVARTLRASSGARLVAVTTDGSIDEVVITASADFAIAQVRYALSAVPPEDPPGNDPPPGPEDPPADTGGSGNQSPEAPSTTVEVDLRPNNGHNNVHPGSHGRVQVAVLSSDSFDATQLDPATITFGPAGAAPVRERARTRDVDRDGDPDVVFSFIVSETGIACGDAEATLTGMTASGDTVSGSTPVETKGCKAPKPEKQGKPKKR